MLYIIIPVHNRKALTHGCLLSLQRQTFKNFKVVVIDDGSTDGTAEMIKSEFPEVELLFGNGHLFWTAATNIGIRYSLGQNADYIMTLNDDTVASEDFIEKMLFWAEQKQDALVGALAIDVNTGELVYGGAIIDWKWNRSRNLLDELAAEDHRGVYEVTHFPGRGLLIPANVFDKTGLFDEKALPHHYADYDFTHRAARSGFEIYCNYDAKLFVYPEENGDYKTRKRKSVRGYYNHLFGIKGGGNLKNFTRYTFRNCPPRYVPYFLVNGYVRRIAGYLIK